MSDKEELFGVHTVWVEALFKNEYYGVTLSRSSLQEPMHRVKLCQELQNSNATDYLRDAFDDTDEMVVDIQNDQIVAIYEKYVPGW